MVCSGTGRGCPGRGLVLRCKWEPCPEGNSLPPEVSGFHPKSLIPEEVLEPALGKEIVCVTHGDSRGWGGELGRKGDPWFRGTKGG